MKRHYLIALLALAVCTYAANDILTVHFSAESKPEAAYAAPKQSAAKAIAPVTSAKPKEAHTPDDPASEPEIPNSLPETEKADPSEEVTMIQAPTADRMGAATLTFPVKIPAGRNGMQPELIIDYNSEGANGWLGLNWKLNTPAIMLETRWGVPRYDAALETETYMLNGGQLNPVAHRSTPVARTAEKQFHARVEGEFEKIIRHGNSPSAYWWEVTDKNGVRKFYGGSPSTGVDATAILTDANGNIAYWALTETRDPNNNFVKYRYAKVLDPGNAGGSFGYDLYISSITYTGNGATEGKFSVEFTRDRQLGETKRADVLVNARWGFKQVTADLLRKIAVKYNGQPVRSYELSYIQGAFYKSLLSSVKEFDAGGALFNTHSFEYYNDVQSSGSYQPLASSTPWNPQNDNVHGTFLNPIPLFTDKASALDGNKSLGGGFGMAITVGPYDGNLSQKSQTAGVSFGFTYSKSEGMLAMVDINGDGLIDKVYKRGGDLYFRANQSTAGSTSFGPELHINGINDFSKGETFIGEVGLESHFVIFAGFEYSRTEDLNSVYFSDVNGDRLMDIVRDGVVYFNHIENGNPTFTVSSGDTPSPIDAGSNIDGSIVENDPVAFEKSIDDNPLHDVVKVWRAPFTGTVSIVAPVALLQDNSPDAQAYTAADGVRVAIQLKGSELWSTDIPANDFTAKNPTGVASINVVRGDKIYFRVQSKFNGAYDQVSWSPQITYSNHQPSLIDANGLPLYQFKSDNDFLLSGPLSVGMTIGGQIKITGDFTKPVTSDDVTVKILRRRNNVFSTILEQTLAWNNATTLPVNIDLTVLKDDAFFFSVSSSTNIDWTALQWHPFVYFTASTDPAITQLYDQNNNPMIYTYPTVDFKSFNKIIKASTAWTVPKSDTFSIQANPDFNFIPLLDTGRIVFSIKKQNELVARQVIPVAFGAVGPHPAISLILDSGAQLYFEYYVNNEKIADGIDTPYVVTSSNPGGSQNHIAGLHTNDGSFIFGPLYRHWGQFAYNGNRTRATAPINELELKLDDAYTTNNPPSIDLSGGHTIDEMQGIYDSQGGNKPNEDIFIYLLPDNEHIYWLGYDNLTYVKKDGISASRMGKDNLNPVNPIINGSPGSGAGAAGITKVSNTDNFSLAAGIGPAGISTSFGYTKFLYDFADLNGDMYPDILSTSKIQYTHAYGGLEAAAKNFSFGEPVKTEHFSAGFTLGGTFLKSSASNEKSTPKGAKASKASNEAGISAGISGNFNYNRDSTAFAWLDINNDDLPDRVYRDGNVELNLGYSFLPKEQWGFIGVNEGQAFSYGAGLSINIGDYSISAGIGLSRSESETLRTLEDMNGDGLLDYITQVSPLKVAINTGNGFAAPVDWAGANAIHKSVSTGESVNGAFTIGFAIIPIVPVVKLCINPSFHVMQGADRTRLMFSDIDGDGSPDLLQSDADNELSVSLSTIKRSNLLKKVNRPLGANFTLDYKLLGNTYDMPNHVWALVSVDVYDGLAGDGADHSRSTFEYQNGHFARHEREFYGFGKVITRQLDTDNSDVVYRITEENYLNDNFYENGLLKSEVVKDAAGNKFNETIYNYELKDVATGATLPNSYKQVDDGAAFAALVSKQFLFYEGGAVAGKTTNFNYAYDALGNITQSTDFGDPGAADDVTTATSYHSLPGKYIMNVPASITITGNGQTLRQHATSIDANGNVTENRQFLESGDVAKTNMEYDALGNVTKLTNPQNATGQRLSFDYEYDAEVQTYRTKISDSYGYSSSATYDVRFEQMLSSTDINGQKTLWTVDNVGRVKTITGPFEIASGQAFTISYEYHPEAAVPWALTKQFDPAHPSNFIESATFCDGFGRIVQEKRDGAIFKGANLPDEEVMIVSGANVYDAFGRTIKLYYPVTEAKGNTGVLNNAVDAVTPSVMTFDVLDRLLTATEPDLTVHKSEYGFGPDRDGVTQFRNKLTDGNGIVSERFTNVRQLLKAVKHQYSQGTDVWTSYDYNAINELVKVTDDKGNKTISVYDRMGRRTSLNHPDAGLTTFEYDLNDNVTQLIPANLQGGIGIKYSYDRERVQKVIYPQNTQNNVTVTYGAAGAPFFRAGRMVTMQDGSGTQENFYDALGSVVKSKRVINIPGSSPLTYTTEWTYDTWKRLMGMVYPDSEALTYAYNVGGRVQSMLGVKSGTTYNYLPQVGYDKFEDKVYMRYGNNTEMSYAFEPERRRLKKLTAKTAANRLMMDLTYTYDKEDNILNIVNAAPVPPSNLMGGSYNYQYTYDDLYRITNASGNFKGSTHEHRYSVVMKYDNLFNITNKKQTHERKANNDITWVKQNQTTYEYSYNYNANAKPHAAFHIGDKSYTFDGNGNQTGWKHDVSSQKRDIVWDEDNRLKQLNDNGETFNYTYDAESERVLKSLGSGQTVRINGKTASQTGGIGNYVVYVNPFVVIRSGGFTKHFYIDETRIVSKLGESGNGNTNGSTGGGNGNNLEAFQFYYHGDHLGNTAYVTDRLGEVYQHLEYFPFGETFVDEHGNQERTPYLYNGKELDEETGLYYYGARYYDTRTSQWESKDQLWELPNHIDRSPYAYVLNNPLVYYDPDGMNGKRGREVGGSYYVPGTKVRRSRRKRSESEDLDRRRVESSKRIRVAPARFGKSKVAKGEELYLMYPGEHAVDGAYVPAPDQSQHFSDEIHEEIDRLYKAHGCHSCGKKTLPVGKRAVPDHQPVSCFVPAAKAQKLYPQCPRCSSKQGGLASKLKKALRNPYWELGY